jgi:aminocarboxymuconate-semialdehyde decarboxylase
MALPGIAEAEDRERFRVDVHSHCTPPEYLEALRAAGGEDDLSIFRAMPHLTRVRGTVRRGHDPAESARRIAELDAAGVDLQIISIGALQPYVRVAASAIRLARELNDAYADYVSQAPARLAAFAALPLPHVGPSVAEASRVLDLDEFAGVALGASAGGLPLDAEEFAPLWEELDRRGAVVYLHPGVEIAGVVGCGDFHLAPDFVSPAEIAVAAARMVVTGLLERHPRVRVVLATFGGALAFLARRFDTGLRQTDPSRYEQLGGFIPNLGRFWVDSAVIEEPDALSAAVTTFGSDRVLLGSDFPRPGCTPSAAVDYIERAPGLTTETRTAILGGNARELLRSTSRKVTFPIQLPAAAKEHACQQQQP